MKVIMIIATMFWSAVAAGSSMSVERAYDVGVGLAPTFAPEVGYNDSKLRFVFEGGVSFIKYSEQPRITIKGISHSVAPTFRLLRIGVASIQDKLALTFTPLSVMIRDKAYMGTTFGFGKQPYTIFSFNYVMWEDE